MMCPKTHAQHETCVSSIRTYPGIPATADNATMEVSAHDALAMVVLPLPLSNTSYSIDPVTPCHHGDNPSMRQLPAHSCQCDAAFRRRCCSTVHTHSPNNAHSPTGARLAATCLQAATHTLAECRILKKAFAMNDPSSFSPVTTSRWSTSTLNVNISPSIGEQFMRETHEFNFFRLMSGHVTHITRPVQCLSSST